MLTSGGTIHVGRLAPSNFRRKNQHNERNSNHNHLITMSKSECVKKCLRRNIAWFVGSGVISTLVSLLIGLGVMFPGAGTVAAILIGIGLFAVASVAMVLKCWSQC